MLATIPREYSVKPLAHGFKIFTTSGLALQVNVSKPAGHDIRPGAKNRLPFHLAMLSSCHNTRLVKRPKESLWSCASCGSATVYSEETHRYINMQQYFYPGQEPTQIVSFLTPLVEELGDSLTTTLTILELTKLLTLLFERLYVVDKNQENFTRGHCSEVLEIFYGSH